MKHSPKVMAAVIGVRSLVAVALVAAAAAVAADPAATIKTFEVFELTLHAQSPGSNPYINGPGVTAIFRGTAGPAVGKTLSVKGFWDGAGIWRVRFAPVAPGHWSYRTSSSDPGLDGATGSLAVTVPTTADFSAARSLATWTNSP